MFEAALVVSTLLVSLVAGLVFAYAVVAMPGLAVLGDREFLRASKVTDRVIQDNQPLFMVVWIGSAVALVATRAPTVWHGIPNEKGSISPVHLFVSSRRARVRTGMLLLDRLKAPAAAPTAVSAWGPCWPGTAGRSAP
jgi:uncharacterized membrane protein